jgi:hypothetical protein
MKGSPWFRQLNALDQAREANSAQSVAGVQPVTITPREAWALLLYSVRYALNRESYAVSESIDLVLRYRDALTNRQLEQIAQEIDEHLERQRSGFMRKQPDDIIRTLSIGAANIREAAQSR